MKGWRNADVLYECIFGMFHNMLCFLSKSYKRRRRLIELEAHSHSTGHAGSRSDCGDLRRRFDSPPPEVWIVVHADYQLFIHSGQGCRMCTDCKALWGDFVIWDIELYRINWIKLNVKTENYRPDPPAHPRRDAQHRYLTVLRPARPTTTPWIHNLVFF